MPKRKQSIPVNTMADSSGGDISIERLVFKDLRANYGSISGNPEEESIAHRHDIHSFFLLESGTVNIEIHFHSYTITAPALMYVHPDQVHRTVASENVVVSSWAINDENLSPAYLNLLKSITPAKPIVLINDMFGVFEAAVSLFITFSKRNSSKLYHHVLKDSCNALVALAISQYLEQAEPVNTPSRFDVVTKAFREALEHDYIKAKRPAAYAQKLNISTPYLNECVKTITGYTVSYHINQRVILEAKRLLYYSKKTVKEIAAELGYDDYPYFSRLFTKTTGMSALAFRSKNRH